MFFFVNVLIYICVMSNKILIVLGLVGVGVWWAQRKKNFAVAAKFNFKKLDFNMKAKKIVVYLGVLNPTGQSLNILSMAGDLILDGKVMATVTSFEKQSILPNQETTIKVFVSPNLVNLFSKVKNLVQSKLKKTGKLKAAFKGSANIEGANFPINTILS